MLSRCPGEEGTAGRGVPSIPPLWARTPVGAAVRGAGSTRGTEGCATVAGERGPGAAGLLVKARCNSRLFPRPVAKSPAGAGTRPPAPTSASASVLAAAGGVFSSPLARAASSCLAYCLSPAARSESFPCARRDGSGSSSERSDNSDLENAAEQLERVRQFAFARPELRLQACSLFVALSNLNNSLLLGCFFQPLHLPRGR